MPALAYTRTGSGEPMVLLHGLGSWRRAWDPVIPALAEHFDVIAVDLPGFGDSPPLSASPAGCAADPAVLGSDEVSPAAPGIAGLLDEFGVRRPHIAGNSLGGWVALELARIRQPASVTLLSPAGLWGERIPLYDRLSLQASRWICKHAEGLLYLVLGNPLGRIIVLGQTHGRPVRMSPGLARATIRAMAASEGFDAVMRSTIARPYQAGPPITAPVTVAFGSRDLLLRRRSRRLDQLPHDVRVGSLPRCGHIPMADNPAAVAALILQGAGASNAAEAAGL
jgi:pimeloyl-ACP methyl ester carboxylesterase